MKLKNTDDHLKKKQFASIIKVTLDLSTLDIFFFSKSFYIYVMFIILVAK